MVDGQPLKFHRVIVSDVARPGQSPVAEQWITRNQLGHKATQQSLVKSAEASQISRPSKVC